MNKIKIQCQDNNRNERLYIFSVLFGEFPDLEYDVEFSKSVSAYNIFYKNNNLCIDDAFFSKYDTDLQYLAYENIPKKTNPFNNSPIDSKPPIIFGKDYYEIENDKLYCGLDIFASAFFMLSRWEELVIPNKNRESRPNEFHLLSVKENFFNRPVVDEYIDLLEKLLNQLGVFAKRKKRIFDVLVTHDVDWLHLSTQKQLLANLSRRVFKKGQTKKSFKILYDYYYYRINRINPFDCFNELITLYKKYNINSAFYFKAVNKGEKGFTYDLNDKRVIEKIRKIENAGHKIGFHPSENTVLNNKQFTDERKRLQENTSKKLIGGRNHGLYYNEKTYRQWEENGFYYDSGMGFQHMNGFRNGTANMFPIFDIYERKPLNLYQRPFIAMDTVVFRKKTTPDQYYEEIRSLLNVAKKYNGTVSINWHSNLINSRDLKKYKQTFFEIIKYISELYELD